MQIHRHANVSDSRLLSSAVDVNVIVGVALAAMRGYVWKNAVGLVGIDSL